MDVYGFFVLAALVSYGGGVVSQAQPSRSVLQRAAAAIANNDIDDTTSPPVKCTTAKGVSGVCTERQYCEYSTYAIDLTLFAPKGYVRFLKDWPKWDEFDQGINFLRKKNASKSIKKTLESKYIDIKNYLRLQLELAKPLAQETVKEVVEENAKRMEKVDTSEITLEVYCTRKQLNELVLSQPISGDNENTVFNLTEFIPTSIIVNKLPIEAILNWIGIRVTIETKKFTYHRSTNHQLKHVLVNSKNGPRNLERELHTQIQIKDSKRTPEEVSKDKVSNMLSELLQLYQKTKNNQMYILQSLIEIINNDIHTLSTVQVPTMYRQHSNKYPYYRKLKTEVETSAPSAMYDLYIEETLAPIHNFHFRKVVTWKRCTSLENVSFVVECLECALKFSGDNMYTLLREHFDVYHANEPDWNCTHCNASFTMTELARNKWRHVCTKT